MVLKNLKDTHHIYRQGKQGGRPREGQGGACAPAEYSQDKGGRCVSMSLSVNESFWPKLPRPWLKDTQSDVHCALLHSTTPKGQAGAHTERGHCSTGYTCTNRRIVLGRHVSFTTS